ncbi:type I-B CRISPR-associated endonuclease Cas1b [Methanosphaera sp. ISO3-F5]|uniref:type I-B CRISPR-associated endonuclease Cas1b n=1 Tax=Methanosphaera sp. ISO3-F5 TaxID=1452353 RepID=UPI002B256E77|nr:type I-B CRISPR-associated endonuclease Cas1b [Methanosphaera sp. ISO3-F5]
MKQPLNINSNGILYRKDNTLKYTNKEVDKTIPIHAINEINCYGKVSLKSGAITLLQNEKIIVNSFNKYGHYQGSLYPKITLNSGTTIVKQALAYNNPDQRNYIAQEIVQGMKHNMRKTLMYYSKKGKNVTEYIEKIEKEPILNKNINQILSSEGKLWQHYYPAFNEITKNFPLKKREFRPPTNEMNALISFGNSLLYTTTLSEIYHTYLHPSISFLHEPRERRFSLACDIADIFKPIIVSRTIFKLVNTNMINKKSFKDDVGVYLTDKGRQKFIEEYNNKLKTTIKHPNLNKKVSYRYLIRLEGYKLIKHILNDKTYESFKAWW